MSLLQSWKESLLFLKPKNLWQLFLVTFRIIRDSYKFFLVTVLLISVLNQLTFWMHLSRYRSPVLVVAIQVIAIFYLIFLCLLVARPSVQKKGARYMLGYSLHLIYFVVILLIFYMVIAVLALKVPSFATIVENEFVSHVFVPAIILWLLFWLDSRLNIGNLFFSLIRAIKMYVFNFPFCLVSVAILYLLATFNANYFFENVLCWFIVGSSPIWVTVQYVIVAFVNCFIWFCFFIFFLCLFTNFYTKRLHDQFKLYFGE